MEEEGKFSFSRVILSQQVWIKIWVQQFITVSLLKTFFSNPRTVKYCFFLNVNSSLNFAIRSPELPTPQ